MYLPINRIWSKRIALILIIVGLLIMSPPGTTPDDFINFFLGAHVATVTGWDYTASVVFTYFMGIPIFLLGLLIYPYNTKRLLISYSHKAVHLCVYMLKHPIYLIAGIAGFILLWYIGFMYYSYIATSVEIMVKNLVI